MGKLSKVKKILIMIAQLLFLIAMLYLMTKTNLSGLLGTKYASGLKIAIEFLFGAMNFFGMVMAAYLPSRRHRILRDTQIHGFKYLTNLSMILGVFFFLGDPVKGYDASAMSKFFANVYGFLIIVFIGTAIWTPVNFIKNGFTVLKSVEYRDPRKLVRQLFS